MADTVPHAVADSDGDGECEPDGLIVPLVQDVAEEQKDTELVPHGDKVWVTDTVPLALTDGDAVKFVEADKAEDPPLETVPDEIGELDSVVEIVGDRVGVIDPDNDTDNEIVGVDECVPDTDCDREPVPHVVAVSEADTVPHALESNDADDSVEGDGAVDPPLEPVPDELNELDCVVEIVGEKVGVTDPDCDTEPEPHGDAV